MSTCSPVAPPTCLWMPLHMAAHGSNLLGANPGLQAEAMLTVTCTSVGSVEPPPPPAAPISVPSKACKHPSRSLSFSAACRYSTPNRKRRARAYGAVSAPAGGLPASSADTSGSTGAGLAAASLAVRGLPDLLANPYGGATAVQDLLGLEVTDLPGGAAELAARCWPPAGGLPQAAVEEGQQVVWPDCARPGSAQLLHKVGAGSLRLCLSAPLQLEGASSVPAVVMRLLPTARHGTACACTGPTVGLLWWLFSQAALRAGPLRVGTASQPVPHLSQSLCPSCAVQGDGRLPILPSPILPAEVFNPWLEEMGLGGSASAGADAGMSGQCSSQLAGEPMGLGLATLPQPSLCLAGGYVGHPLQPSSFAGWPDLATRLLQDNKELRVRGPWGAAVGTCCPGVPEASEAGQRREASLFPAMAPAVDVPTSAGLQGLLEGNAALREALMAQGGPGESPCPAAAGWTAPIHAAAVRAGGRQGRLHRGCQMHAVLLICGRPAGMRVCRGTCHGQALVHADGPRLCLQVPVGALPHPWLALM